MDSKGIMGLYLCGKCCKFFEQPLIHNVTIYKQLNLSISGPKFRERALIKTGKKTQKKIIDFY